MTNKEILDGLNDDQKKPVLDFSGPSFIMAGPGSGKTKTIVSRTAYMINKGVPPENIILFTFTNKAAKEIKSRIADTVEDGNKITIGTYHSICVRILRRYSEYIGFNKNFSIFDTSDSSNVLKKICKESNIEERRASSYISDCKKKLIRPEQALRSAESFDNKLAAVYRDYQNELRLQGAMDFDDLIINTIALLENNPDVLKIINNTYKYIMAEFVGVHFGNGADNYSLNCWN